jgi:hypothetical protein
MTNGTFCKDNRKIQIVKYFTGLIKNQSFGLYLVVGFDPDNVNSLAEGIKIKPMFHLFSNG